MAITIHSINELHNTARQLLQALNQQKLVAFYGTMGSGKTTLIRAICQQLGCTDEVTSPTFSLVNEYDTKDGFPIYHFDFYRIEKEEELFDIGFEDYAYSHQYCFIEWPEKAEHLLPPQTAKVKINALNETTRNIELVQAR